MHEWESPATETVTKWQFQNCSGAADGKHIMTIHATNSGVEFYNYKGLFLIVLPAIVDYDYKFTFADVGGQGRISNGSVYHNSYFYRAIEGNLLNLFPPKSLPILNDPAYIDQYSELMPHVFLGDDAVPLGEHCLKPYSQSNLTPKKRIFNYRLSRVRRITKNAFGIWLTAFKFL